MDHLGSGKDWDLARKTGGLILLPPFGDFDNAGLYKNRLEALKSVSEFVNRRNETTSFSATATAFIVWTFRR